MLTLTAYYAHSSSFSVRLISAVSSQYSFFIVSGGRLQLIDHIQYGSIYFLTKLVRFGSIEVFRFRLMKLKPNRTKYFLKYSNRFNPFCFHDLVFLIFFQFSQFNKLFSFIYSPLLSF
jgi:hypothetical protein